MGQTPNGVHAGGVVAILDLVDVSVVVAGIHGELLLTDTTFLADLFQVLAEFESEEVFFLTPSGQFLEISRLHRIICSNFIL